MITNPFELWLAISGERADCPNNAISKIKKAIYKGTDCGAWVNFESDGVEVGSIVEGVDEGTETFTLKYPFEIKKFWEALDEIEKDANRIWKETHGCEDCGPENEMGYITINPDCKTCRGGGTII